MAFDIISAEEIKNMIYYCTNCWKEILVNEKICPHCGFDQNELENESYTQKLIRALNHPEPATPVRAANILSKINAKEAVPHLLTKLKTETDPFIIEAVVKALLHLEPEIKIQIEKILGNNLPASIKKLLEN